MSQTFLQSMVAYLPILATFLVHLFILPAPVKPLGTTSNTVTLVSVNFKHPSLSLLRSWKDQTLGSGADYFVPRLPALRSLSDSLLEFSPTITAASILSNCARLDAIYFGGDDLDPTTLVSSLYSTAYASSPKPWWRRAQPPPLLPSSIERHATALTGPEDVSRYLSLAACTLNNPRRRFDPYNSRDGHVLLQLKRARDAARGGGGGTSSAYSPWR